MKSNCQFSKAFQRIVIQWFKNVNYTNQHPSFKETFTHLFNCKQNAKRQNRSITLPDFVNRLNTKYDVE